MAKFEEAATEFKIKDTIVATITAALGFVTAFVWRDAIQQTISTFVPEGQGLMYTYIAAVLVTILAMVVIYVLYRIQKANIVPDAWEDKVKHGVKGTAKKAVSKTVGRVVRR